jgi:hypothetical protein
LLKNQAHKNQRKMRTLKFLSVALILLVGMILTFHGCQKDEIILKDENSKQNFKVEKITFNDFSSNNNNQKALNFIEKRLQNSKKDIVSDDGHFKIATENILMLENEYGSSYSFNVINQLDPNHTFENFVVTVYQDGHLEYRIIGFTSQENNQDNFNYTIESLIVDNNFIDIEQFFTEKTYLYWDGECLWGYDSVWQIGWEGYAVLLGCPRGGGGNDSSTGADGYTGPSGSNNGTEGGTYNPNDYTGGTGSSSSSSTFTPIAVNIPPRYTETVSNALFNSDYLTPAIQEWLNNADYLTIKRLATFLTSNNNSPEAVSYMNQALLVQMNGNITNSQLFNILDYYTIFNGENVLELLNILNTTDSDEVKLQNLIDYLETNTPLINSTNQTEYETAIMNMTNYMRQFGYPDLVPFADYIDSLIPEFIDFTMGDVEDIYQITRQQYNSLRGQYFIAIIKPVAEAMLPFIQFAIVDATIGAALPVLTMIPLNMVKQGSKLEQFVLAVNKLGVPYTPNPKIRDIFGSSVQRAERLFVNLTKNAVSVSAPNAQGTIVANMGNNCYITYRTSSSTGAIATLDFNFPPIWGAGTENIRKLKFFP